MRERRAAHVRPLPPSGDRLRSQKIKASAPSRDLVRRYRPIRTSKGVPAPIGLGLVAVFLVLGLAVLIVGGNILVSVAGQLAHAFDSAISQVSSMPPATAAPSGVALDTPVLNTPDNGGYTNQAAVSLSGSVPGSAIGKTGYKVRIYGIASDKTRKQVSEVEVGSTTHFSTGAVSLVEGPNTFAAALVTPSSEGQPSPEVVYILDTKPPQLSIASPADGSSQAGSSVVVSGKSDTGSTVTIRNRQSPGGGLSSKVVGDDGRFAITVGLVAGSNSIQVTATDQAGNVTTSQLTVKRSFGNLSAHLTVSPAKFKAAGPTTIKLTVRATSANGGPLAGAEVVFTVTVAGLGPIVSPALITDQTGTTTWKVTITGATPGLGQAAALVTTGDGNQIPASPTTLTTT
jgi:hypothetical protein